MAGYEAHIGKHQAPQCVQILTVPPNRVFKDKLIQASTCLKVVPIPLNPACPEDFFRVGDVCLKAVEQSANFVCPQGTNAGPKGECVHIQIAPPRLTCPNDMQYRDGQCVHVEVRAATQCPHGSFEKHGQCFQKVHPVLRCPVGYEPGPKDECVSFRRVPADCRGKA
eukprot:GHVT01010516.1.p1 GENE.GHVT01010516.1~~GHVT01010516.1.p1  ORF type:complete len:167 (-),score=14.32 GHVT01010516.1:272-772(-)